MPNAHPVYHKAKKAAIEKARNTQYATLGKGTLKTDHNIWWGSNMYKCKLERLTEHLTRSDEPITVLDIGNNKTLTLDFIGDSLENAHGLLYLNVFNNGLIKLPNLPQSLYALYCRNNQLTELPALPEGLKVLNCANNQLTELPALPEGLKVLNCADNQLTELPPLPTTLEELLCNDNNLTYLPDLPKGLTYCTLPGKWAHYYVNNMFWSEFTYNPQLLENYPRLAEIKRYDTTAIVEYVNRRNGELSQKK